MMQTRSIELWLASPMISDAPGAKCLFRLMDVYICKFFRSYIEAWLYDLAINIMDMHAFFYRSAGF